MKKVMAPLLISTLFSGCSNTPPSTDLKRETASNERYRPGYKGKYDGPPPSFQRDSWERRSSESSFCDKYRNDTAKHVLACAAGVDAAKSMAQKFAGEHGREDGYLRGYAWGLSQSINYYQNSPYEMERGESQIDSLRSYFKTANNEGDNAGYRDGESLGTSEAKGLYYRAVDTKVMPSPKIQTPATNFNPTQDAYTRYVAQIPTPEEIMKRDSYGRIIFYDSYDRNYSGSGWKEKNRRDMWSRNGDYTANSNNWIDGNFAFGQWIHISNAPGRQKYELLSNKATNNETKKERSPVGSEQKKPGTSPGTITSPEAQVVIVDYQEIFKEAFIKTYKAYAPIEYSQKYHSTIDNGQRDGEDTGYEVGSEIAQKRGLAAAFNREFAQISHSAYQKSFSHSFSSSFNSTFNNYKNNAVLSLDFMGIIGADDDGVIQPGESFGVKFKVTNAGGVGSKLQYTVAGDVENEKTLEDSINAISSKTITSPNIGEVLSNLEDGTNGSYILNVNGIKEKHWQAIKRPLVMSGYENNLSPLDGTGLFTITIANISTIAVNGNIALELKINGVKVKEVIGSPMQAGEKQSYALDFTGLDPYIWITKEYAVEINLKYNNTTFSKKAISLKVSDIDTSLAQYFTRLINEKGTFPSTTDLDKRLSEIRRLILGRNTSEVKIHINSDGNIYRTDPERTVPGKILREKEAYSANSPRARSEFTSLSDAMASEGKKFKSFLFIHPKKNAYNELLSKIGNKKYK